MDINTTIENLKRIHEIAKTDTVVFNMILSHLFHHGMDNFTEETLKASLLGIEERHKQAEAVGKHLFMTAELEKEIQTQAFELSKLPLNNILLYIKKNLEIFDPEVASQQREENHEEEDYVRD
jgi:hypothetical protein